MIKVFLIGYLARDPELSETSAGVKICRFTVAVNRRTGDEEKADFYRVTAWRGLAEVVSRYTHKGSKIAVSGDLAINDYTDKDGVKRISVDVTAQDIELLTLKEKEQTQPKGGERLQSFDDDGSDIPF